MCVYASLCVSNSVKQDLLVFNGNVLCSSTHQKIIHAIQINSCKIVCRKEAVLIHRR